MQIPPKKSVQGSFVVKLENAKEAKKSDDLVTNNPAFEIKEDPRFGHVFKPGKTSDAEVDTTRSAKKRKAKGSQEIQSKKLEAYKESVENQPSQVKREFRASTDSSKSKLDHEDEEEEQSICSDF